MAAASRRLIVSEFRILPPTRRAFASNAPAHIIGADGVRAPTETSRTDESIHGVQTADPSRPYVHVIHGVYNEGTYIVTSRRTPQPAQQSAVTREQTKAQHAAAWRPSWAQESEHEHEQAALAQLQQVKR